MTQLLPPKKEVALALLERSNVDVYLDPRARGVVVPPQYRKEPRLILKIGLNMPVPIPDLRLDDESMSCTLSFNRMPFFCVVPWPSVFAMVGDDGRGMVWPDDVPQELAVRVVDERRPPAAPAPESSPNVSVSTGRGRGRVRPAAVSEPKEVAAERSPRGKKPKKKKDDARPALVAVPPAPPSARDIGEARESREARIKDGVSPVPPAPRPVPAAQRKAKRELPPYLRVVK
jgi:stringent starvation protein B